VKKKDQVTLVPERVFQNLLMPYTVLVKNPRTKDKHYRFTLYKYWMESEYRREYANIEFNPETTLSHCSGTSAGVKQYSK
jgi:hypothetical protein